MASNASRSAIFVENREISGYESYTVRRDIGQPDTTEIVLSDLEPHLDVNAAAPIKIVCGDIPIFIGEVVGIDTTYDGMFRTKVIAMNKLHRLTRGRRSEAFPDRNEQDIFKKLLSDPKFDLSLAEDLPEEVNFGSQKAKNVVHCSNQTPMEFLAMRAARYGYHVWCVDNKVRCIVPDLTKESEFALTMSDLAPTNKSKMLLPLKSFSLRMSSADVVSQVIVRSSDPDQTDDKEKVFIGVYPESDKETSPLGREHAVVACKSLGEAKTFTYDLPVFSKAEAKAIAKAEFVRRSLSFITGRAVVDCHPELELGKTVEVVVSSNAEDPLNGNYYVMGITHRFVVKDQTATSYETELRLARDAQKPRTAQKSEWV